MADEYGFHTTINLGGLTIPVEVEFTVTSWGASEGGPSAYGPGEPAEPPEFHITQVFALDTGMDLTGACQRNVLEPRFVAILVPDPGQDPIRAALFGLERGIPGELRYPFQPYRTRLIDQAGTILETLEAEIMMDANALTPPVDDDWDPRDWE